MTPRCVFDGQHLRLLHIQHGHRKLMVTFDFRMPDKHDFGPVNPGAGFARHGFDQLMVKTRRNDWFINTETTAVEAQLRALALPYDHVTALGFSMGGYGALRFASALSCQWVMAVSPQLTIAPDFPPFDRRYTKEATRFDTDLGRIPALPELKGTILYDPFNRPDRAHARALLQLAPQLSPVALPLGGHPATQILRDSGKAGVVQRAAMQLVPPDQIRRTHRKARAASSTYWTALARQAGPRHSALVAQLHRRAEDAAQKPAR